MSLIVRLIAQYALWIYILCALGMIFYLRAALAARREGSQAIYSLERETAAKRVYRSSGTTMLLLAVVIGVYALSHYVDLPEPNMSPIKVTTPTPAGTVTPASKPTASEPTQTAEPTATRRAGPTTVVLPTIVRETPTVQVAPAQCPHLNVQVVQPGSNQVINTGLQIVGTATKENFDRYEFKFQSRDFEDEWHWVETFRAPVESGDLGLWSTGHLPNGNYRFMLIVIDRTGNSQECTVPVVIQH